MLEGTVTDPSERVIVGANVKILVVDTGISQEQPTNAKGYYHFPGLAVGRYTATSSDDRVDREDLSEFCRGV